MHHKLLLADDSITIQKVVELTLSEEDFEVTAFGDGESALDAARKIVPDIILADVFMPKMDGYQLCGMLKKDPALKDIPVLLLAGTFENFDDAMAARVGADDHITKPFESAELISKVKKLVERKQEAEPLEEALFAEEAVDSDDLWSVVDMQSEDQPLAGATETMSEEDLWKRANLVSDFEEAEPLAEAVQAGPAEPEDMDWDAVPEPVTEGPFVTQEEEPLLAQVEAVEPFVPAGVYVTEDAEFLDAAEIEDDEIRAEPTAVLNLDDLEARPLEPVSAPAMKSSSVIPEEMIKEEVLKVAREVLDKKIKEALSAISGDIIEQVVWEIVPGLAEEIISREIEKLKAGMR